MNTKFRENPSSWRLIVPCSQTDTVKLTVLFAILRTHLKRSPYNNPRRHTRGEKVYLYSFFNFGARWGGWPTPRAGRFNPGKGTRYPFYRRSGGCWGQPGPVR